MANSVWQGGILSPILFTVYELMQQLSSLGIGCHWKGPFVGCVCYMQMILLYILAPSAYALRRMLKICSEFAAERNSVFNAGNIQLICFR